MSGATLHGNCGVEQPGTWGSKRAPHLVFCLVRGPFRVVRLKGFEPPTFCSGGRCSIH